AQGVGREVVVVPAHVHLSADHVTGTLQCGGYAVRDQSGGRRQLATQVFQLGVGCRIQEDIGIGLAVCVVEVVLWGQQSARHRTRAGGAAIEFDIGAAERDVPVLGGRGLL